MPKKENTQQVTNALLDQKLTTLTTQVVDGFKGVHERQDKTNGKVIKAGDDITQLQSEFNLMKERSRYNKIVWYMFTISMSFIIALTSYILFK